MDKRHKYQSFLLRTNGKKEQVNPKNGTDFSLDELQGFVHGYIQIVHLGRGEIMVINEEGKLMNLPLNKDATIIAKWNGAISSRDGIVGNALLCHESMVK